MSETDNDIPSLDAHTVCSGDAGCGGRGFKRVGAMWENRFEPCKVCKGLGQTYLKVVERAKAPLQAVATPTHSPAYTVYSDANAISNFGTVLTHQEILRQLSADPPKFTFKFRQPGLSTLAQDWWEDKLRGTRETVTVRFETISDEQTRLLDEATEL